MLSQNSKGAADCQIVSAVNAYEVLTGKSIPQDSEYYKYLCKLGGAIAGPAFKIESVWNELGLEPKAHYGNSILWLHYDSLTSSEKLFPLQLSVQDKVVGSHAVLCTGFRFTNIQNLDFKILYTIYNFNNHTDENNEIDLFELNSLECLMPNVSDYGHITFKLKNNKNNENSNRQ